jgi:hypothetical protein
MSQKSIRFPKKIAIISLGFFLTFPFLLVLGSFTPLQAQSSSDVSAEVQTLKSQIDQGLFGLQSYATPIGRQLDQLRQLINQNGSQSEIIGLQMSIAFGLYSLQTQVQAMRQKVARIRQIAPNYIVSHGENGDVIDLILQQLDEELGSLRATLNRLSEQNQQQAQQAEQQQAAQRAANQASIDSMSQAFTQQGATQYNPRDQSTTSTDPMAIRMTQSANPLDGLPVATAQATTVPAASGRQPTFTFKLLDNTKLAGTSSFDQGINIPLTALSWTLTGAPPLPATATQYAVIINDPDKTLPATVSVTVTGSSGPVDVIVDPTGLGSYTIILPSVSSDGTPATVTASGITGAPQANAGVPGSGTITITGNGIQTLAVTVRAY